MMLKKNILFLVVLIAPIFFSACKKQKAEQLPVVVVEYPKRKNIDLEGEYVGRIRPNKYVEIHARVVGYLEKMLFSEGKRVNANQPLFSINQAQYKARAEKARAQLKKDKAQTAKAERDVQRLQPLFEQNAVSKLDLENAVAALENAQASVAMSKADLDQAELELSYTTVRSPISGYVSERHVDIGSLVGGSGKSLLATVVETDTVLVDFKMTALDYLKSKERNVSIGERDSSRSWQPTVTVTLADNSVYPLKGIVDFADPQVDPQTGTFTVRAQLYNPDRKLLPGQFTKVKLLLDVVENAIIIPRKAVSIETGGAYVYVIKRDSTAERRFVEISQELENEVIIERGLSVYDQIVTEGFHKLKPGTKARPVHSWDKSTMENLKKEDEV
ncbi:MAG: efflux RND transporter periplasmic adaptor subunit [Bacteroidales bacterium]